jgi:hypothetical protein
MVNPGSSSKGVERCVVVGEHDQHGVRVKLFGTLEIGESVKDFNNARIRIGDQTAPHTSLRDGIDVEPSHNPEIVLSTLERHEEICVRCRVCVDDITAGKNDFEVLYCIADPPLGRRVITDAA